MTGGYFQKAAIGLSLQVKDTSPQIVERLQGLEEILSDLRSKQDSLRKERTTHEKEVQGLSKTNYRLRMELDRFEERFEEQKSKSKILQERIDKANLTISELETQVKDLQERDDELSVMKPMKY